MSTGSIFYAIAEDRAFLKLVGSIRYPLSTRLSLAVGRVFEKADVHGVVVDLQEAEFIDSTCMGLLARVATQSMEQERDRPVIVSKQPEINRVLRSMGFDRVFLLVEDPASTAFALADAAELAGLSSRPEPQLVLDAHRALSEMNEKNQHLFQNVIEQLEAELGESSDSRASQKARF